jgi:hypothetical protein
MVFNIIKKTMATVTPRKLYGRKRAKNICTELA